MMAGYPRPIQTCKSRKEFFILICWPLPILSIPTAVCGHDPMFKGHDMGFLFKRTSYILSLSGLISEYE
jgi:hypothetical protein